jgi:hypothetical protein
MINPAIQKEVAGCRVFCPDEFNNFLRDLPSWAPGKNRLAAGRKQESKKRFYGMFTIFLCKKIPVVIIDGLVKSQKVGFSVIPAKAGIQLFGNSLAF